MITKQIRHPKLAASCLVILLALIFPVAPVLAHNYYGSGYYGECLYSSPSTSCDISISNTGFILFLPVQPTPSGQCTIQSDQVSVSTYDPSGYTLTLINDSTATGLLNGSSSIPATGGTPASPLALTDNWGYRVDGWSGFGAGPTTGVTNASPNGSITFAGTQPNNGTPDTIAQTAAVPNPYTSTSSIIWYGVCLDTSLAVPEGSYTSTVLYTATAN